MTPVIDAVPMMDPDEVEAMRAVLLERKPRRVLEWGSGGSTLVWPRELPDADWLSIEHDPAYARAIRDRLPPNVDLRVLPYPDYWMLDPGEVGKFDLIVVDGRKRLLCLEQARQLLADDGAVLLHDAGRERYHSAFNWYGKIKWLVAPKPRKDPRGLVMLAGSRPQSGPRTGLVAKDGVIYLCWGEPAQKGIEESVISLWNHAPGTRVHILGGADEVLHFEGFDDRVTVDHVAVDPFKDRSRFGFLAGRIKPLMYRLSPFERTLYVDADTTFMRDPAVGFDLLDRWDFVIAEAETRSLGQTFPNNRTEADETAAWLGSHQVLYHNSGMMFWRRNPAVERLFDLWRAEWSRYGNWDEQVALLRALSRSEAVFLNVPYTWNSREAANAFLLHHRFASLAVRKFGGRRTRNQPARRPIPRTPLVNLELEPGRVVKVHPGDEEKVRAAFNKSRRSVV